MGIDVSWRKKHVVSEVEQDTSARSSSHSSNEDLKKADKKCDLHYTAFVVDDVQAIRKLLRRTLLGLGFTRVEVFENGKRALDAMKKEMVDVVFMDIQVEAER